MKPHFHETKYYIDDETVGWKERKGREERREEGWRENSRMEVVPNLTPSLSQFLAANNLSTPIGENPHTIFPTTHSHQG